MNNVRKTRRYVRIPTVEGVTRHQPVSDFVLNLGRSAKRNTRIGKFWPRVTRQSASFLFTLILCISSFGITYGNPMNTLSYFRDLDISRANMFAAGLLGFRVNPGDIIIPISVGDTIPLAPLFEPKPNSFAIQYRVHTEIVGDETSLCSLLHATGTTSPYLFDTAFKDVYTDAATTTGHGYFEVTLPTASGIPDGEQCTIALEFRGWYVDAPENTGYTDKKRDTFTFVYRAPVEQQPQGGAGNSDETPQASPESPSQFEDPAVVPEDSGSTPPADTVAPLPPPGKTPPPAESSGPSADPAPPAETEHVVETTAPPSDTPPVSSDAVPTL